MSTVRAPARPARGRRPASDRPRLSAVAAPAAPTRPASKPASKPVAPRSATKRAPSPLRPSTTTKRPAEPDTSDRRGALASAAVVILFLSIFGIVVFQVFLMQAQGQLDDANHRLEVAQTRARDLRVETAQLESPTRIAQEARDRLGMIAPGEVGYLEPRADDADRARFDPARDTAPRPTTTVPTSVPTAGAGASTATTGATTPKATATTVPKSGTTTAPSTPKSPTTTAPKTTATTAPKAATTVPKPTTTVRSAPPTTGRAR